ncbi:MAG: winged helix-turn-helix domain-containing protein [Chloroflexi bacterium]|nr:winged helix-turn-helix domain-containing protein [Chloroflexota bacterium]
MSRSTLHLRLFLAFALVALLSALASALVVVAVTGRRSDDEAALRLHAAANAVVALLEAEKDRDLSDAAELAARLGMQVQLEPTGVQRAIGGSRLRIKDDYVAVVDSSARLVAEDAVAPGLSGGAGEAARLALASRATALLELHDGVLRIEGAAPIVQDGALAGAVVAGDLLDSRFLGRVKRTTGLEVALVGGERLLSSTLEELRPEVEQGLAAALQAGSTAERLQAEEQVAVQPRLGGAGYVGLFVPLDGAGGRAVAILFLGMPASQLAARQLDLLSPLLGLVLVALLATSGVSFLEARALAVRLAPPGSATPQPAVPEPAAPQPAAEAPRQMDKRIVLDGLEIDRARHEVRLQGNLLSLTPTEFQLLCTLAGAPGQVFTRQELMERVWGTDFMGESGVVDTHVGNLRRKLEAEPANPRYILTVRGVGFKFREAL